MTFALRPATLTQAAKHFVKSLRAAWKAGPVPCWTDYMHDTSDKG